MSNRPNCVCSLWASLVLLGFGSVGWGQIITTVAGNGLEGYAGDGGPASQAQLNNPWSMAVDEAGNLYIADTHNYRIRRVDGVTGVITTVAGTGDRDYAGDGGPASQAQLNNPWSVAVDGTGNLYIASGVRIRRVDATTGIITTVAGTAVPGFSGDGGPATDAQLNGPSDVAVDGAGHLYIADGGNYRIRRVDGVTGVITTVAGTGDRDYAGDGGPATQAQIWPIGVAVDGAGHLYIADGGNYRIRRVDGVTGVITTVAGTGEQSLSGDDGPVTMAQLLSPKDVAFDPAGHLYIADGFRSSGG